MPAEKIEASRTCVGVGSFPFNAVPVPSIATTSPAFLRPNLRRPCSFKAVRPTPRSLSAPPVTPPTVASKPADFQIASCSLANSCCRSVRGCLFLIAMVKSARRPTRSPVPPLALSLAVYSASASKRDETPEDTPQVTTWLPTSPRTAPPTSLTPVSPATGTAAPAATPDITEGTERAAPTPNWAGRSEIIFAPPPRRFCHRLGCSGPSTGT